MKSGGGRNGTRVAVSRGWLLPFLMASTPALAYQVPAHFTLYMENLEFLNFAAGPAGDGVEDNWGIANVKAIYGGDPAEPVWEEGDSGEHLRFMYWGLDTTSFGEVDFTTGRATVDTTGAFAIPYAGAALWLWDSDLPAYLAFDPTGGPEARTGYDAYPTISGGNVSGLPEALFAFGPGVLGQDDLTLGFLADTGFSGVGAGYLDVVAGSGVIADLWDTNGFPTDFGSRDIFFRFNFSSPGPNGWQLESSDPLFGNTAIPEPATMLLCAIGLMGMASVRRGMKG